MRTAFPLLLALIPSLVACSSVQRRMTGGLTTEFAVMQGATSDTTTQIAILLEEGAEPGPALRARGKLDVIPAASVITRERPGSPWRVLQLRYDNLQPGVVYELELSKNGKVVDRRELETLRLDETKVTWGVVSCMDDAYEAEQLTQWNDLVSFSPRFLLFIGDNVYGDRSGDAWLPAASGDHLWKRHAETRRRLAIFRQPRLTPIFAVWDDHDFGANDGDETYPHREESKQTFEAFFPQGRIEGVFQRGPGMASSFEAFGQRFLLADDRMFRSPPGASSETHWGSDQEAWLVETMKKKSLPTWLANGDQFFGAYHRFESYERIHPKSFRGMLKRLSAVASPIVFLSGDRHLAEIMAVEKKFLGYPTYEITSSAIHSKTFPNSWENSPNPRQIAGVSGALNYLLVTSEPKGKSLEFVATSYGVGKAIHFQRSLRVDSAGYRNVK